jgi:hypothetical protein
VTVARQRSSTRIWLVRTHMTASEQAAWNAALSTDGLSAELLADGVTVVPVG